MVFVIKKTKTGRFLVFEKSNGKSRLKGNFGSRKDAQNWIKNQ